MDNSDRSSNATQLPLSLFHIKMYKKSTARCRLFSRIAERSTSTERRLQIFKTIGVNSYELFLSMERLARNFTYSRVQNKRRGMRIIGVGWKWFHITIIRGAGIIGGVLGEIENILFLRQTRICYTFMRTVMLLIHLLLNSGSVECTSSYFFLRLFRNYV